MKPKLADVVGANTSSNPKPAEADGTNSDVRPKSANGAEIDTEAAAKSGIETSISPSINPLGAISADRDLIAGPNLLSNARKFKKSQPKLKKFKKITEDAKIKAEKDKADK